MLMYAGVVLFALVFPFVLGYAYADKNYLPPKHLV